MPDVPIQFKDNLKDRWVASGLFAVIGLLHLALFMGINAKMQQITPPTKAQAKTIEQVSQVFLVEAAPQPKIQTVQKKQKPPKKVTPIIQPKPPETKPKSVNKPKLIQKPKTIQKPVVAQPLAPISTAQKSQQKTPNTSKAKQQITAPSTKATAAQNKPPVYPRLSKRLKEQGVVKIKLTVLKNGTVEDVILSQSSGFERLDTAAIDAVQSWRYTPASKNGKAIDYVYVQPVEFSLR